MARERRNPRQPDPGKKKDFHPRDKKDSRRPKEDKPFHQDDERGRKGDYRSSEKRSHGPKEEKPGGDKKSWKPREEKSWGDKKSWKPREEKPRGDKKSWKPREERPGDDKRSWKPMEEKTRDDKKAWKPREERSRDDKRSWKPREEKPRDDKKSWKPREDSIQEDKKPFRGKDDRPGKFRKDKRGPVKQKPRKYTGEGKKEGEYIPKRFRPEEAVRLNKYIAGSGICSRREADELIKAGVVRINDKVVTELGSKVMPTDKVYYEGQLISNEKKRYILLNKQKGYVTTTKDPHATNTVMELIAGACKERVYPVGRLDRNTTGLLLFTNDGELSKKLMHPSSRISKLYHVVLDQPLKKEDMMKIAAGIELDDGPVKVDGIEYDISANDKRELGLEIHVGKNRVIRRIFASLDYKVVRLDRVMYAGLTKKNLPRGKWRFLTDFEIRGLQRM